MAGHSHWSGIKHKKGVKDQKRGAFFSKLLSLISVAAKDEPNPEFNPRLRTAIDKAKEASVPQENIERAIARAREKSDDLEEVLFETYGPGGVALLIAGVTSSRNRAVAEVKKILADNGAKWAEPGSVRWAFEELSPGVEPKPKFTQPLSESDRDALQALVAAIEEHGDVQGVYTNAT